jgi:hypothetical protein
MSASRRETSSMTSGQSVDRRHEPRITINKDFESFDAFVHEYVMNVSRSGVYVKTKETLPIGTRVNLCFRVIMDTIETIEGVGEVIRVEQNPPGMGVVFVELGQYSQRLLERLIMVPANLTT